MINLYHKSWSKWRISDNFYRFEAYLNIQKKLMLGFEIKLDDCCINYSFCFLLFSLHGHIVFDIKKF